MSTTNTILLLGSNLGNRSQYLETARTFIFKEVGEIIKFGEIIETEPVEFTSNNLFLNQLVLIQTSLSPINLLNSVKKIENKMGRTYTSPRKNERFSSRNIDIDIIKMGEIRYQSKTLNIPHNQIYTRDFVKKLLYNF